MTPHYTDPLVTLYLGDCLDVMRELPDASVDSVVTDPPYGLEFMGKEWDSLRPGINRGGAAPGRSERQADKLAPVEYGAAKPRSSFQCDSCGKKDKFKNPHACDDPTWTRVNLEQRFAVYGRIMQLWHEQWATEAFRVLKPGGYLLAFGGTRTYHRLASAIEDAGFEIRDTLMWIYASGFPKSLDVSKALDKVAGAEREVVGEARSPDGKPAVARRGKVPHAPTSPGATFRWGDEHFAWDELPDNAREYFTRRHEQEGLITAPATDLARKWEGWGTALKPAHEPIVMARKPLVGTVAANVTRYGTGALNIDGTRIGTTGGGTHCSDFPEPCSGHTGHGRYSPTVHVQSEVGGRWPSNVMLGDPELFDEPNPWVVGSGATTTTPGNYTRSTDVENWGVTDRHMPGDAAGDLQPGYGDSGGYSRFFIIPKADRAERERGLNHGAIAAADNRDRPGIAYQGQPPAPPSTEVRAESAFSIVCAKCNRQKVNVPGAACKCPDPEWIRKSRTARANVHPTVKPIDLMRHLVRLVTPPGGVTLDPFLGSGTTALAASEEGFRCIGIEREAEYLEIAVGRLMATPMGLGLDVPAPTKKRKLMTEEEAAERVKSYKGHVTYSGGWGWEGEDGEDAA